MKKITLHIGADKCGSSSIQKTLSNIDHFYDLENNKYSYGVIKNKDVYFQPEIKYLSKNNIANYFSSENMKILANYTVEEKLKIRKKIMNKKSNLIFSCEGWLRANPKFIPGLLELFQPLNKKIILEIKCVVRPPVYWINSAWWQWGIWQKDVDFYEWFTNYVNYTNWFKYISNYKEFIKESNIEVIPHQKKIEKYFFSNFNLNFEKINTNINSSLPKEVFDLYLFERLHRPSPHESKNDFLISRILEESNYLYSDTPWVLSKENIKYILKKTNKETKMLLQFTKGDNCQKIINDSAWWDFDHYKNKEIYNPKDNNLDLNKKYLSLSSDLLFNLNKSLKILEKNNLLNNFFEGDKI